MHNRARTSIGLLLVCASLIVLVISSGCGAFEESPPEATPTPSAMNVLVDAGFEGSAPAWTTFPPTTSTEHISADHARSGASSLAVSIGTYPAMAAVQSVNPKDFPEFLSGYYRIDHWREGDAYLQFVVKARAANGGPDLDVRFLIAGAALPPETGPDARYVFLSRGEPATGDWTYFAYPLKDAFEHHAGGVPTSWASIDVSLEIHGGRAGAAETAYFDDVYLGPQAGNPNHPKQARD